MTILGLGGVGKSRLTKAAGKRLRAQFAQGVYWVELAPVLSADLIPLAIANAMQISLQGTRTPLEQLQYLLAQQQILLVLDNFEHLLPENEVCQALLEANPKLKILVTSRLPLNVYCEWLYPLGGLAASAQEPDSAFELFLQTAHRLNANFLPSLEEQQAIKAICHLVEGLPLGIEIAASWVRCLSCQEILHELQRYFQHWGAKQTNAISAPALNQVLQQSWQMLSKREKQIMHMLSLFRGTFKREAAAGLLGVNLGEVRSLIDKSMISRNVEGYFTLHEVMRQYAHAQSSKQPLHLKTTRHFVEYHLDLAERADTGILGQQQINTIAQLESERDNFRDCLNLCSVEQTPLLTGLGLKLVSALGMFWFWIGHWQEGYRWSRRFLAFQLGSSSSLDQAKVLLVAGGIATLSDQYVVADRYLTEGIEVVKRLGESVHVARGLIPLAVLRRLQGRHQDALTYGQQSLQLGDQGGYQFNLVNIGHALLGLGRYDQAIFALEESIALNQQLGVTLSLPYALVNLERVYWQQQQVQQARTHLQQSLDITEKLGMLLYRAQAHCILAWIDLYEGQADLALKCFEQSLKNYLRLGDKTGQVEVMRGMAIATAQLGDLTSAWRFIVLAEDLMGRLKVPLYSDHQTLLNEAKRRIQQGLSKSELELLKNLVLSLGIDSISV